MDNSIKRGLVMWLVIIAIVIGCVWATDRKLANETTNYTYKDLQSDLEEHGKVVSVAIQQNEEVPTGTVGVEYSNGTIIKFYTSDVKDIVNIYNDIDTSAQLYLTDVKRPSVMVQLMPYIIIGVVGILVIMIMLGRNAASSGSNAKMANFGRSKARMMLDGDNKTNFKDVAGLQEEKEELAELVDFLKTPSKYVDLGARIPKGVLLEGPPGTGKTLLAKAIAGEAGVPFFSISGSEFVEMFVGVGASRVRDLFEDAKKHAPCIIFIDEIDAVARRRGSGHGGGHDEREQTLNQLLVEMDGFEVNSGIIVMAATNRVDILDPAILRPGRFDRKVYVGRPDVKGRREILGVHTRKKPLGEDIDLQEIARTTAGFSGADLENLMNESAISAAKDSRKFIVKDDVEKAFIKVGIGTEKKSRVVPEKDKEITAYHEAGHAILFHVLDGVGPVYTVSIIPTGTDAAGYTMPLPENDNVHYTRGNMLQDIKVSLGGRIAEEMVMDDITSGASQDIKQATKTARAMVERFGMSKELGIIDYATDRETVSEKVSQKIDSEVKKIIDECYVEARKILEENINILHSCAKLLLEKERIDRAEFEALFDDNSQSGLFD